jgi:Fe-S-cluster containining protein
MDPGTAPAEHVTIEVQLGSPEWQLRTKMTVPAGPTRPRQLLPLLQALTNAVVDVGVKQAEAQGKKISCQKGCGACCRQLVPISEVEARAIAELVANLPEPRRTEVRQRFADAQRRLQDSGLLKTLLERDQWTDQGRSLGLRYFLQGIPCPFLEDESCSIHPDRPLACREYLVTSPAAHCAQPTAETVHCVPMPFMVWNAAARFDETSRPPDARWIPWVPLILAPSWAETHPDQGSARPGPELLREFFEYLTGKKRSSAAAPNVQVDSVAASEPL